MRKKIATVPPEKKPKKKKPKKKKEPNPVGRPLSYTDKIAEYICRELMMGRTLTSICKEDGIPTLPTVFTWLSKENKNYNEDFLKLYMRAREIQADTVADEVVDIARDNTRDFYKKYNKKTGEVEIIADLDHIQRDRLAVDTLKWKAARLYPMKYSERMQLTGKEEQR